MTDLKEEIKPLWKQCIGPTTWFVVDRVREMKITYRIGGLIPSKEKHMWDDTLAMLDRSGVKMNRGGLFFIVYWGYRFLKATEKIASQTGYNHVELTNNYVNFFCGNLERLDVQNFIVENEKIRNDLIEKADDIIVKTSQP